MMRFSPFACRGNWFIVGWLAGERMGQGVLPAALLQKLRLLVAWSDTPNRLDVLEAIDAVLSRPGVVTLWEEVRP